MYSGAQTVLAGIIGLGVGLLLGIPAGGLWEELAPGYALSTAQRELAENTAPVEENDGIPVELHGTWDKIAALEQRFDAHKTDIEGFCVAVARRGEVQMAVDAKQREDIARVERLWRDIATADPYCDNGPQPTPAVETRSVLTRNQGSVMNTRDPDKQYVGVFNAEGSPIIYADVPHSTAVLVTSLCLKQGKFARPPDRLAP